jgi:translation initiation factor 3 subunit G
MPRVGGKVACRLCKGEHFTAKCPYKDTLAGLESTGEQPIAIDPCPILIPLTEAILVPDDDAAAPSGHETSVPTASAPSTGGKYVPPSMRGAGGARAAGESMRGPGGRDDLPTLRVTNISEDTQENDLRELFGVFGRVARVYVGRDRETGAGKGFAFVSFEDRAVAQKAMEKVNGKGYDSLILSVQWSRGCSFAVVLRYC